MPRPPRASPRRASGEAPAERAASSGARRVPAGTSPRPPAERRTRPRAGGRSPPRPASDAFACRSRARGGTGRSGACCPSGRWRAARDEWRGGRDVEDTPTGVGQPTLKVHLLRVDEEVGVQVADRLGRVPPDQHRARLNPADLPRRIALSERPALGHQPAVEEQRLGEGRAWAGVSPRAGDRGALRVDELGARYRCAGLGAQGVEKRLGRAVEKLGVLVQQQAGARPSPREAEASCSRPAPPGRSRAITRTSPNRAVSAATEPSSDALSRTRISYSTPVGWATDGLQAGEQQLRPLVFTTQ